MKITFFIVLLIILGTVTLFPVYKNALFDKTRLFLSKEITNNSDYSVDIGRLNFSCLSAIDLYGVSISKKKSLSSAPVNINEVKIAFDIQALVFRKELEATLYLDGIEKNKVLSNAIIKTYSKRAASYRNIFDPSLITDISLIDTAVSFKNFHIDRIYGDISVNDRQITGAKVSLFFNDRDYLIGFYPYTDQKGSFESVLHSKNIDLTTGIKKLDNRNFIIDYITGTLYCLKLDLFGRIKDITSSAMDMSLEGELKTNLAALRTLPGNLGKSFQNTDISGTIISQVSFKSTDPSFEKYELLASLLSGRISVKNVELTDMEAGMTIKNGRLDIPDMTSLFYRGKLSGDIKLDLKEKGMPYILSLSLDNMFLDEFIENMTGTFSPVYGDTFAKLSLRGYGTDTSTMEGSLEIEISKADLGPMPLIAPLLGDIYSILRDKIIAPENRVNISRAYGEFTIKNRQISTDNAVLLGDNIAISGTGHMDFDGSLDFTLENKFTQAPIEEADNWQTNLRNTIIRFGKALGKAKLKGTIQEPKWMFDYFNNEE